MDLPQQRARVRARYPELVASVSPVALEPAKVPESLRAHIALAELWGLPDDLAREALVERASEAAKQDLLEAIEAIDDELDDWLTGPEADNPPFSREYIAFSAMRMAADLL